MEYGASRSSSATLSVGNALGQILAAQNSATNLILNSQDFSQATWTATGALVVSGPTLDDPRGMANACVLSDNNGSLDEIHVAANINIANNTQYVFSVFVNNQLNPGVNPQSRIGVRLLGGVGGESFIQFNGISGVVSASQGANSLQTIVISPTPVDGFTSFYRVSVLVINTNNTTAQPYIQPASATAGEHNVLTVFGAQLEIAPFTNMAMPSIYIPTGANPVTLFANFYPIRVPSPPAILVSGNTPAVNISANQDGDTFIISTSVDNTMILPDTGFINDGFAASLSIQNGATQNVSIQSQNGNINIPGFVAGQLLNLTLGATHALQTLTVVKNGTQWYARDVGHNP